MDSYKEVLCSIVQLKTAVYELQETQEDMQKLGVKVMLQMKKSIDFDNNLDKNDPKLFSSTVAATNGDGIEVEEVSELIIQQ